MSDRERDSIQEMEDIQKGLEAFLQQELQGMQHTSGSGNGNRQTNRAQQGNRASDRSRQAAGRPAPQMFDLNEDDEDEEELDVIGSGRRAIQDDYGEDWDDPAYRKRQAARRAAARKTEKTSESSRRRQEAYKDEYDDYDEEEMREDRRSSGRKSKKQRERDEERDSRNAKSSRNNKKENGKKENGKKEPKKKKKSGFKRFLIAVALILVFLAAGLYVLVGKVYAEMNYEEIESVASSPMKEEGVTNILLIGNDSRENGEDGRSDAMILLSISNRTKKIYMTSLLRDMYVEIPGYKDNRLNAAYSYGGAELLMETIEQNFDIHISRYVLVNFEAFANLVDAVGGVDLELTGKEVEYVNGYLVEYNILLGRPEGTDYFDDLSGGMVHLNGPQALAYCRNRYIGTDFGRTERQRKVLTEVIHKLPKGVLTNPKGLIDGLMPNLTTNLTQTECYRLSLMAPKILTYDIIQNSIPIEGTYKDATHRKMSVLEVDFEANKKFLQENLYGTGDSTATAASEN
jgi:LCP family protein required for cell wall assembly